MRRALPHQGGGDADDREDPHDLVLAQSLGLLPPGIPVANGWGNNIPSVFANASFRSGVFKNLFGG